MYNASYKMVVLLLIISHKVYKKIAHLLNFGIQFMMTSFACICFLMMALGIVMMLLSISIQTSLKLKMNARTHLMTQTHFTFPLAQFVAPPKKTLSLEEQTATRSPW